MKIEADIIKFLQSNATVGWITFFQGVTMLGSLLGFVIAFVIIFRKNKSLSIAFAFTFAIACVLNLILKAIIARERPFESYSFIHNYGGEDGFSMPSGHSMSGGLFATFLIYFIFTQTRDKWTRGLGTVALALFPILIAFSRMILGVHYLTDTIVGIFVGIMFAIIGIVLYNIAIKKIRKQKT